MLCAVKFLRCSLFFASKYHAKAYLKTVKLTFNNSHHKTKALVKHKQKGIF